MPPSNRRTSCDNQVCWVAQKQVWMELSGPQPLAMQMIKKRMVYQESQKDAFSSHPVSGCSGHPYPPWMAPRHVTPSTHMRLIPFRQLNTSHQTPQTRVVWDCHICLHGPPEPRTYGMEYIENLKQRAQVGSVCTETTPTNRCECLETVRDSSVFVSWSMNNLRRSRRLASRHRRATGVVGAPSQDLPS